jgi:hypothetical protein
MNFVDQKSTNNAMKTNGYIIGIEAPNSKEKQIIVAATA